MMTPDQALKTYMDIDKKIAELQKRQHDVKQKMRTSCNVATCKFQYPFHNVSETDEYGKIIESDKPYFGIRCAFCDQEILGNRKLYNETCNYHDIGYHNSDKLTDTHHQWKTQLFDWYVKRLTPKPEPIWSA